MAATGSPIQTGRVEEIRLNVSDVTGVPLTGATGVLIRIQRASDEFYYDFDDATFKSSGWSDRDTALSQIDATLLPGIYELTGGFDTAGVTNLTTDDTYIVFPVKGAAPDTADAVLPSPGEFKIGWHVDAIGLQAFVSATIGSATPDTMQLMAWLVRNASPVTTGLVGASVSIQDATGSLIIGPGAMSGPNAAGVFTRTIPGVTLATSTNYIALLTITDANGAHTAYTAIPTLG